ncbi:hypothetical protein ANOBCDAF_03839 [Pleomorphomonas sp. T1.2MG-36]|nr:hypothetical protein ANOBCDAF_03839 [Pleomorphomonas sp. T1.2MG-36]
MHTEATLAADLRRLGIRPGDLVMVHASLKAIGPVDGGARAIVDALRAAVGPEGTLMGYASWDRSPYEETLNGAVLDDEDGGPGRPSIRPPPAPIAASACSTGSSRTRPAPAAAPIPMPRWWRWGRWPRG